MNKVELTPILIITPFFAPQTHAAMFRVHKLVKYLPDYGYKPIVLTTDINYLYNNNEDLLAELPDCVEIIRTRHIEPSLRGLRMLLGGRDRTFSALKKPTESLFTSEYSSTESRPSIFRNVASKLYSSISRFAYSIPDAHWPWALASYNTAEDLVKEYDIKLMYTTANPYSHLFLAAKLKKKLHLKWLADFRDPCGYGQKNSVGNYLGMKLQEKALFETFEQADEVSGLSEAYSSIFHDLYNLDSSRYTFIPTGSDDAYLPKTKNSSYSNAIVFSGEVMHYQGKYIFEVIQSLHKSNSDLKVVFIGRSEINKPIIDSLLIEMSERDFEVEYIDHLTQLELYIILKSAKACILTPGDNCHWWNNFAKMVDYIALGVPVIADVPKLSEARKELTKAGLGFFLERNSVEEDALRLQEWLVNNDRDEDDLCADYRNRYLASSQTKAFATLFDKIAKDMST